jgi:hypothetical protein
MSEMSANACPATNKRKEKSGLNSLKYEEIAGPYRVRIHCIVDSLE